MTVEKLVKMYRKGMLTALHVRSELLNYLTEGNYEEWRAQIPEDLWEEVIEEVRSCPTTDEGWGRMIVVQSWCGPWNDEIKKAKEENDKRLIALLRRGVEVFRANYKEVT